MRHLRIKVPVPEPRFPEGSFRVRHRYGALCENPEAPVDLKHCVTLQDAVRVC
jgi:hypothetical protein